MRLIHLLRKPVSEGTVASNVLKHGVGAINIEASRISTQDSLDGGAYAKNPTPRADSYDMWTSERKGDSQAMRRGFADYEQPAGRWPANLILQHLPGCRCEGTRRIKAPKHRNPSDGESKFCHSEITTRPDRGQYDLTDEDGNEIADNWICEPGCPVAVLDARGGSTTSKRSMRGVGWSDSEVFGVGDPGFDTKRGYDDEGGVSRFYKQVGGEK